MKPNPVPLPDVNLADLDVFERNEAWGMFDTLRDQDPVHWTEEAGGNKGFWAITRFEDIERIDKDPATFTSTKFTNLPASSGAAQAAAARLQRCPAPPLRGFPARPGPGDR